MNYASQLEHLSQAHRAGLSWFEERAEAEIPWPAPIDGLFLLNKAKGIHKPKGWRHALSVRQSLASPYADKKVITSADGSLTYEYHQEGDDPMSRDKDFTNLALLQNMIDSVPVAVVIQVKNKPDTRYKVLGLAYVVGWKDGFFELRSISTPLAYDDEGSTVLHAVSLEDARRRVERAIVARQGAGKFRARALELFNKRCVITGYDAEHGLEAAHIIPYLGKCTNAETNSLLLRADLHTLFDCGLLAIDPDTLKIRLSPELLKTNLNYLEGKIVQLPNPRAGWQESLRRRSELYDQATARLNTD